MSKFENQLKGIFTNLVQQKTQIWSDDKQKAFENMNENYAAWFKNVTTIIEGLDFKHSTKTGRKIQ